jgi:hypothetical protein
MQTNILSAKFFDMASNAINTLMVALGTVTFIWILAFLIVGMIE